MCSYAHLSKCLTSEFPLISAKRGALSLNDPSPILVLILGAQRPSDGDNEEGTAIFSLVMLCSQRPLKVLVTQRLLLDGAAGISQNLMQVCSSSTSRVPQKAPLKWKSSFISARHRTITGRMLAYGDSARSAGCLK